MSTEERLTREKEFHNETFSKNSRKAAKKYYKSASVSKEFYHSLISENVKNKKVLEYGCGPGSAAFDLARSGALVFAIDISDVAIQLAKDQAKEEDLEIDFQVMDAENLTFNDNSFDVICGSGILHHLDLTKAYSELNRVLSEDGKTVFFEPLGHNPIINLYRLLTPSMRTEDEHPLLMKDIIYAEEFFEGIQVHHFNLLATVASFIPSLSRVLNKTDGFIFQQFPFLRKYSWIAVLEFSKPK